MYSSFLLTSVHGAALASSVNLQNTQPNGVLIPERQLVCNMQNLSGSNLLL